MYEYIYIYIHASYFEASHLMTVTHFAWHDSLNLPGSSDLRNLPCKIAILAERCRKNSKSYERCRAFRGTLARVFRLTQLTL